MLCIHYEAPGTRYIDDAPQIYIQYRPEDETLEQFISEHPNQHIYIEVHKMGDENDNVALFKKETIERFCALKEKFKNWSIVIDLEKMSDNRFRILKDMCHNFVISNRVDNWEDLQEVLSYHPSEIYITNELGFDLPRVKAECDKRQVKLRAVANVAQCRNDEVTPPIKRFFIRPEDVNYYNEYLHGIEFYGDKIVQEVCYRAYDRHRWFGNLSEIIVGLDDSLDSMRLPANFGELRVKCGKRCIKGSNCTVCRCMQEFVQVMRKTESYVKI